MKVIIENINVERIDINFHSTRGAKDFVEGFNRTFASNRRVPFSERGSLYIDESPFSQNEYFVRGALFLEKYIDYLKKHNLKVFNPRAYVE